ncbi:MAG: FAD-dependent oxidoreductase [Candidatus Thorarchaeota archaeon]
MTEYDVVVIGGGSTGTAVARDCAMRGLKTLLLERDDIASATVGTCAGMISSGFKYYHEPDIMDMCSEEVVHFRKIAKHIVAKLPILFPLMDFTEIGSGGKGMEEYEKRVKERGVPPFLILTPEDSFKIEPTLHPDLFASGYVEEFFIDPFRLCILQAKDAAIHRADVRTYCEVTDILVKDGRIEGLSYFNRITAEIITVKTRTIISAAGPWASSIAELAGLKLELRLNKGAHIILDRRVTNVGLSTRAVDGRWVYMFPHENTTLIGTTAIDTWDNPDELVASQDEIEYLLKSFEFVLPSIRDARIIRTMEGVRPMAPVWKVPEGEVTRGYDIINHEQEGVEGFYSFIGGKLVMCRHMAEAATNLICSKLGIEKKCETHLNPLPGMADEVDVLSLSKEYGISLHALERLKVRRGSESLTILEMTRENPEWKSMICTCEPVMEAEIRYTIQHEYPQTLNDIRRRVRLGTGPCQGTFCTYKAASILAEEMELTGAQLQTDIMDYLSERWKGKRPPIRGAGLAQEEVVHGIYSCVANLDQADVEYEPKPWEEVN